MRNVNLFGMSWNVNLFGKLGKSKILQSASDLHIWIFAGDAKLFFCKTHMLVLARDIHRKKKKRNLSINDPKLTITITYLWLLQSWPNLGQQPSPPSPFFSPQPGHRPPIRVCEKYVNNSSRFVRYTFLFSIHTGRKKYLATATSTLLPLIPSVPLLPSLSTERSVFCCLIFRTRTGLVS